MRLRTNDYQVEWGRKIFQSDQSKIVCMQNKSRKKLDHKSYDLAAVQGIDVRDI